MVSEVSGGLRRVAVAGAGGFIGSRVVRALTEGGCEVHALIRPGGRRDRLAGLDCVVLEVDAGEAGTVRAQLLRIRPDAVVNAVRAPRPGGASDLQAMLSANVAAAAHLMLGARPAGCRRFVQIGSSTEYAPEAGPISEERPLRPVTTHGATKAAASLVCRSLASDLGVGLAVLRPFQVYGPGDQPQHLVPQAIRASLEARHLRLSPLGRRDWVYVDDVAEACLRALVSDRDQLEVNIGSGRQWTNAQLVTRVGAATGAPVPVVLDESAGRAWDRGDWVADVRRARETLGWEPRHDLDAGLAATVAWERSQPPREAPVL